MHSRPVAPRTGLEALVFAQFDAQIGEVGWHSIVVDAQLDTVSDAHAERMLQLVSGMDRPRVLEIGSYAHHSTQIVAHKTGGQGVSHDISTAALAIGRNRAAERGFTGKHAAAAGDFHDLPFPDGSFDLVFVASAVHHTWRPWIVMQEMLRVCRPGGIVHLENEPVGRDACLYAFRGNRSDSLTAYEAELERLGLTRTVTGPFGGTRSEQLFGMVENDRMPLWFYEDTLGKAGAFRELNLDSQIVMTDLEHWMLDKSAVEIAKRLLEGVSEAAHSFSEMDRLAGFSVPGADQIWPLAYRIERALKEPLTERSKAMLFGAALRATLVKDGDPDGAGKPLFSRPMREAHEVFIDRPDSTSFDIQFENILPADAFPASDWESFDEPIGQVIANRSSDNRIAPPPHDGVMVLRVYSIAGDTPYFFSVEVGDRLVYSHCVAVSESHLAKFMIMKGEAVVVRYRDKDGEPLKTHMNSRIVARFLRVDQAAI